MNGVINLKKKNMIFINKSLCVIVPLDPIEGMCYIELVRDYEIHEDFDCIYKITTRDRNWVNQIANRQITSDCESSYTSNSDEELEN